MHRIPGPVIEAAVVVLLLCHHVQGEEFPVADVTAFDRAVSRAQPGDSIVLADGEWRDADLRFRGQGQPNHRILVSAQTPGKVILTGKSRLRMAGEHLTVRNLIWENSAADDDLISFRIDAKNIASRCQIEHCVMIGDDSKKERKWVSIYGTDNVVERCWFEGKTSRGTLLVIWLQDGAGRHKIQGNFFGRRDRLGKNGGETIRIGDSETSMINAQCVVSQNYFYRCDGEAEIISNKSCGNRYVANAFVGCSGALTLRHGHECVVTKNVFFGDDRKGTGGVRVIGERHRVLRNAFVGLTGNDTRAAVSIMNGIANSPANGYSQVRDVSIEDNLLVNCNESLVIGNFDKDQKKQTMPPDGCRLAGNRVISRQPVFRVVTPPQELNCMDNVYTADELGLPNSAGWKKATVEQLEIDDSSPLNEAVTATIHTDILLPQSTGPVWKVPGNEYLPRLHQDAAKP